MDRTVKRILGETEEEVVEPQEVAAPEGAPVTGPQDTEVDELANLWTTGNKGDVVRRFMEMDNELSVKLVFAIGRDGAIELARMVDQAIEQGSAGNEESESTEPSRVERAEAPGAGYPTREILGQEHEHD